MGSLVQQQLGLAYCFWNQDRGGTRLEPMGLLSLV